MISKKQWQAFRYTQQEDRSLEETADIMRVSVREVVCLLSSLREDQPELHIKIGCMAE